MNLSRNTQKHKNQWPCGVCARVRTCVRVCVVLKQTTESEIILTTGLIILKQGIKKIYKGILIHVPLKYIYEIKLYQ